jgi:hypothetical protein
VPQGKIHGGAQRGHTKCGISSYGPLWSNMDNYLGIKRVFAILLWQNLVDRGLHIVVHTGEVQGSIPCAPTITFRKVSKAQTSWPRGSLDEGGISRNEPSSQTAYLFMAIES